MKLEIDQLHLTLEGVDPAAADQLARAIVERVGERLANASFPPTHTERGNLRVSVDQPSGDLVGPVADAIAARLRSVAGGGED